MPSKKLTLAAICLATPAVAEAQVPLNQERHINSTLLSAAIGAMIAHECDSIEPRKFTALMKAWELKRYALNQGYSDEEIQAFLDSKAEQDRMRRGAEAYLIAHGAVKGDDASFCAAGLKEIEQGTLAGRLIREN